MQSRAEESFYRSARAWARYHASLCGLVGDAADELEQSFVVHWAIKPVEPPIWTWPASRRDPFLRRAARNHARNFVKRMRLESASLAAYAMTKYRYDSALRNIARAHPEARLFRSLFWQQVRSGLRRLRPGAGDLLAGYLCGATPRELSAESGRTNLAVNQSLTEARKRLRAILAAQGNTEAELRSYVPLILHSGFQGLDPAAPRSTAEHIAT